MRRAPLLIRLFSYFFIFMGVVALAALPFDDGFSEGVSLSFLTVTVTYGSNPVVFVLIDLYFVFAGLVGLAIVTGRSYACDLGILYCLGGLSFFCTLVFLGIGRPNVPASLVILALTLGSFLCYLIASRKEWRTGSTLSRT